MPDAKYINIPPMTVSTGRMSVNDTGSWRNAEPHYIDHTPPCNFKCPAGNDVVGFLRLTAEGKFRSAWDLILQTSPFPGVCGRVCPHPCEVDCSRGEMGGVIKIHAVERFLADVNSKTKLRPVKVKYPKLRIAVIGAGPAGLSCAWQLSRRGYPVTVFEKFPQSGGMMRVGIPDFRLPKAVLKNEIDRINASGVEIKTSVEIGKDITFTEIENSFQAVFIASGFHKSYSLGLENENHPDIVSGISFLRKIALKEPFDLKKKVIVVGGGNTAVDTARTALRLGAEATVIYRRTLKEMPAIAEEIEGLKEEGIEVLFLTSPVKIHYENNSISSIECIKMELGDNDASGRRKPIPIAGSNFSLETQQIFTAIGETAELSFLENRIALEKWGIRTDVFGRTDNPKIFAGGDVSTGEGTVTHAIGSGRKTAIAIDNYLQGGEISASELSPPSLKTVNPHIVTVDDLNLDYFEKSNAIVLKHLSPAKRRSSFKEISAPIDRNQALYEAQRCFSCGTCPECDNCFVFCPDAAIAHSEGQNHGYIVDIKHCKGCGLCAKECPRFCIEFKR